MRGSSTWRSYSSGMRPSHPRLRRNLSFEAGELSTYPVFQRYPEILLNIIHGRATDLGFDHAAGDARTRTTDDANRTVAATDDADLYDVVPVTSAEGTLHVARRHLEVIDELYEQHGWRVEQTLGPLQNQAGRRVAPAHRGRSRLRVTTVEGRLRSSSNARRPRCPQPSRARSPARGSNPGEGLRLHGSGFSGTARRRRRRADAATPQQAGAATRARAPVSGSLRPQAGSAPWSRWWPRVGAGAVR
jgi:hypothetical protein